MSTARVTDLPRYCALIEVRPLPGCEMDPEEHAGAAVLCYIVARDEAEARIRIDAALIEDRYQLIEVEWCVDVDEVEWDHPDDVDAASLEAEARRTGELVYDEFQTWPPDAPDVVN